MSNLSGIGDNKTYRGSLPPREPYYYIRANLDLSGQSANDKVYYFNRDNSFAYADARKFAYPNPDSYPGYYMIEDNAVIGEVAVYSNPDLVQSDAEGQWEYEVGGLYRPSSGSASIDVWGGPTGNSAGSLSADQIAEGQTCYYGSEPLDPDYDAEDGSRRFLGLKISGGSSGDKIVSGNLFVVLKVYPKFR